MAQKTHTRQTLVRMLAFLLAIVTIITWIIMQIPVSVSAAKGDEYPYVAVLREDKNGRNEKYDLVVEIPKGEEVIVLGNSKNYPHRLMVAYGNKISHITPNDVEKVSKSYAAVLPEDKNLRDNSYGYVTKILKGSLVIVKGDSKSYSGRKDIKFGEFSGTIGSKGIVAMTEKEASSIIKSGKTIVGGTNVDEDKKENTTSAKYPYVVKLGEDKNGRNEKYDLVVEIPKGAEVIVLGNSKNYPHRLMVAYGNKISHITPNDVEKVSNSYAAVLPEDKNLRDNSYGYVTKILKGSLVIVKGDSKSYSGRKDIKFGEFSGTIGSKGIVAMTEKEASSIIKSGKTTVGGTSTKENGKLELAVNRYKRTFYNERFQKIGEIPANTKVQTSGKTCTKWGIKYLEVTYNGNKGYIRDYYVDQVSEKNKMIIVDISEQCVYAYESGKLYAKSPCVTGTKGKNDTPLGTFSIQYRERKTRMRGADYDVVVEYTLPFYGNYCLHASDRKSFGGSIYTWNGSHGCVNLPKEFARELYYWVNYKGSNRTPVYVVR